MEDSLGSGGLEGVLLFLNPTLLNSYALGVSVRGRIEAFPGGGGLMGDSRGSGGLEGLFLYWNPTLLNSYASGVLVQGRIETFPGGRGSHGGF